MRSVIIRKRTIKRSFAVLIALVVGIAVISVACKEDEDISSGTSSLPENPISNGTVTEPETKKQIPKEDLWTLKLVNYQNPIDEASVNAVKRAEINGYYVDERIIEDLKAMISAAKEDGIKLAIGSAYRTVAKQKQIIKDDVARYMSQGMTEEQAYVRTYSDTAKPGQSEHHLGLAVDFIGTNANYTSAYKNTEPGIWLKDNAYKFGFILRYPEGKADITKIVFEPWHFRYAGKYAREIKDSGLCLEEYLEANFE